MILHAIAGLAQAAGTSVFCGELCHHLNRHGTDVSIALPYASDQHAYPIDASVRIERFQTGMQPPALVHIHAIWSPFLHKVATWATELDIPVVISPHGMLTPWAVRHRALKKWLALRLYQHADMARATLFHATSQAEAADIRRFGYKQPIVVAPLGADLPPQDRLTPHLLHPTRTPRIALFLSRIHPVKGLPLLLEAWARLKAISPSPIVSTTGRGWRLVIAGPDECGHTRELFRRAESLGLTIRNVAPEQACSANIDADITVTGPAFSDTKAELYRRANIFVLPSHSENFGAVVAEALSYALPVITTTGTPWRELQDVGCRDDAPEKRAGWWIRCSVAELTAALREATTLSDHQRHLLGSNGRWLIEHRYSWNSVASRMAEAYDWALGNQRELRNTAV